MIFVTVGTQNFPFNRLLRELDHLVSENFLKDKIIAQIGYSTYIPKNYTFYDFLDPKEMERYYDQARFIICHGGTSSIFKSLEYNNKTIVVPRLKIYEEHIEDHQIEISKVMLEKGYIRVVWDIKNLKDELININDKTLLPYNTSSKPLIYDIKENINSFKI